MGSFKRCWNLVRVLESGGGGGVVVKLWDGLIWVGERGGVWVISEWLV